MAGCAAYAHLWRHCKLLCLLLVLLLLCETVQANPDAKRLYDDLLSNYNRLIRPVSNNTDTVLVKLGLRLSQLIDLVSRLARGLEFWGELIKAIDQVPGFCGRIFN